MCIVYNPRMKTIPLLISELRATGATQQSIAITAGVSQPTVSRWESSSTPSMSVIQYIKLSDRLALYNADAN